MKKRSLVSLVSASAVSVSSLMVLAMAPTSAAANTYFKWVGDVSGTGDCNSAATTLNCNWSDVKNWETSATATGTYTAATAAPASADNGGLGDNIIFDTSALAATPDNPINDAALTVNTLNAISHTGSGANYSYTLDSTSKAITVTGGVSASANQNSPWNAALVVQSPVVFSGTTEIGDTTNSNAVNVGLNGAVTVASGTLTDNSNGGQLGSTLAVASGASLIVNGSTAIYGTLSGAGAIVVNSPASSSATNPNALNVQNSTASNTFSGTFDLKSGSTLYISSPTDLGTAALTIESGAQLNLFDSPTKATSSDALTIANPITMGGNAAAVYSQSKGAIMAGLYDGNKLVVGGTLAVTLSGAVNLTSDTSLSSEYNTTTTYNFTGALNKNGHSLTAVAADQPTYGATVLEVNGTQLTNSATAPKTPNTGFELVSAKATPVLGTTLIVSGALVVAARRMKPASKRR